MGIQRPLITKRVAEISEYVRTLDACFPTAVILAVPGRCASYSEKQCELTLSNYLNEDNDAERVLYKEIAKVLEQNQFNPDHNRRQRNS